jgi:FkbM family methyltransferase
MALLDLDLLNKKYSLKVKNIVHIGAHRGQEVDSYKRNFPHSKIYLFEPQKKLFNFLENNYGQDDNISLFNYGLGSKNMNKEMYISNNDGQSSSFLKPSNHLLEHPNVKFEKALTKLEIKIFDELEIRDIDFLNIDTQGYELEVLKGSKISLANDVKYIILEVNKKELYNGCPLVADIDRFLSIYNFVRTDTYYWLDKYSWGDAFYIKKNLITRKKIIYSKFKNFLYSKRLIFTYLIILRNIKNKLFSALKSKKINN